MFGWRRQEEPETAVDALASRVDQVLKEVIMV
jgi:hypothetical protein